MWSEFDFWWIIKLYYLKAFSMYNIESWSEWLQVIWIILIVYKFLIITKKINIWRKWNIERIFYYFDYTDVHFKTLYHMQAIEHEFWHVTKLKIQLWWISYSCIFLILIKNSNNNIIAEKTAQFFEMYENVHIILLSTLDLLR